MARGSMRVGYPSFWLKAPGFVLHQEFDELAAAGISSLRILQMTPLCPAQFLGRDE